MAAVRAIQAVKQHIPLIKFPKRSGAVIKYETPKTEAVKRHVGLTDTSPFVSAAPSRTTSASSHVGSGAVKDYHELPARYRRKPIDQIEIEYIQRGGPE